MMNGRVEMQSPSISRRPSPRLLAEAPHRLLFFVGAGNLMLAMGWWAAWLIAARWPYFAVPQPSPYAGWLHAFVMQYQMLPSFFFGFLLTVFPKWLGQPEIARWRYVPVGLGLFGGQLTTLLGALGWSQGIVAGMFLTVTGWFAGLVALAPLLWREKGSTWHARSCFFALLLGFGGLIAWVTFVLGGPAWLPLASIKIGSFGLSLPVYVTVANRMFPFFAGNVVAGYKTWRPLWVLGVFWPLVLLHLALELCHGQRWLWLVDAPLLVLTATLCWRWWPRVRTPAILTVLFTGLVWLPVAFALYTIQSLAVLVTGVQWLGRAPAHALFIGFFGSVLIAMVTRVTQGHSGRPMILPAAAGFAYAAIQLVTMARIIAELAPDSVAWQALAATGWVLAFAPWVTRIGRIYLTARADGRPG
jgi:uncharacterized protein involved in response to NO